MRVFLEKWKKYFTFAALLSCFINILQLTFPFYMFTIYRNVIISYSEVSLVNITAAAFFAVFILGLFNYIRSRLLAGAGNDLTLELRRSIYGGMVKGYVLDSIKAYQGGVNDLDLLRNYFLSPSVYSLFDVPWAPFYLLLIYMFHPVLGIIATSGAVIMFGLSALQEFLIRKSMKSANIKNSLNYRFVDSFMRNSEVINGMGMINAISDRFVKGNNQVIFDQTSSSYYAGTIQSIIKPMQNILQVLIYCSGAYFAMKSGFSVGLMVAASIIMGRCLAPLMQVMSSWRFTMQAKEAYQRLRHFTAFLEQETQKMPLPSPKGHINVAGAVFGINDRLLLKGISFKLEAGEFLGIIGPSGAGKTTLCRLILGIWPSLMGKVYLDGHDIFLWDKGELGQYIGYLPQEIELFSGSVAKNIARLGTIDMDKVEKAIEICGLKDVVDNLPHGVETILEGDEGIRLSGGQKQKIGLARAVYNTPKLLVLDEPTSNLDEQGEQQLMAALQYIKNQYGCTCVMVTHKPFLLQSMDKILVMQDGTVAMFGSKDEVFSKITVAA